MRGKLLPLFGAGLWILGLILFLLGLNLSAPAGQWMTVIGQICFLLGLGLEAVYYLRRRKTRQQEEAAPAQGKAR